ncbi:MAG: hypothetical protein JWP20_1843, partial [Roseomonas sp.]|nr:hypothetical protein [Roseomonas sp.]
QRGPREERGPRPAEGQPAEARDANRPPREGARPDFRRDDRPRGPRERDGRESRGPGRNDARTYSFDAPKPAKAADPDSPFAVLAKLKLGKS